MAKSLREFSGWVLAGWLAAGTLSAYANVKALTFDGRAVVEVLAVYEAEGFAFLYSSGLVPKSLRFRSTPDSSDPIDRLTGALEELGLTLKPTRGFWRVVPLVVSGTRPKTISGRVLDEQTGEPLAGVRVEIGMAVAITDEEGRFSVHGPVGSHVALRHQNYEAKVLASEHPDVLQEIVLTPIKLIDEVIVVSSRYSVRSEPKTGSHLVDLAMLETMPRLGGDPVRVASHLPGTATLGVSAKPHIRGGSKDELLVLFNNIELLEPFHLRDFQSIFSTFNPSMIQSIDVYTGGFPARYGDRMSGVMDITPAQEHASGVGELAVSLINSSVLLHDTWADGRGDWTVSGRRGNLDILTRHINSSLGEPAYSDWLAQARFELGPRTELDVGALAYTDDIELRDFEEDGEIAESSYRNAYGWVQLHYGLSPRLDGSTLVYAGSIKHRRQGILLDDDLEEGEATVDDRRSHRLVSVGQQFRYAATDTVLLDAGVRFSRLKGSFDYSAVIRKGALAELIGLPLMESRAYDLDPDGSSGGAFAAVKLQLRSNLTFEGGIRWDYQDYGNLKSRQWSPRMSVKLDITPASQVRLSAGRFFQPEAIHELQINDGISEYQEEQSADHLILSWHHQLVGSPWSLRLEAFHKRINDPKRRFENLLNPLVLLPELASDRVEVTPEDARARGVEATIRYQLDDQLLAWLSYTHSDVEDRLNGRWLPRTWDQGETISAGVTFDWGRWTLGANVLWHAGWRTTRLPATGREGEALSLRRNDDRLRDYLSLDLKASRTWRWTRQSLTVFTEVTNAFNRANVGGIEYDVAEDDAGGLLITPQEETLLPLVPSVGLRWRF